MIKIKEQEPKKRIVILTVTEFCNLDCSYCYEKSKTRKVMDIERAKDIIKFEFDNSNEFEEVEFDLFGGEPTLRKNFIKEIVEWTIKQKFSKPFIFFIDTNGTVVHGDFQKWLLKHKKYVWVGLSLDGTPETHNKNRSNSYEQIDIPFFVKNYPCQPVRMTVHNNSIDNLSNDIIHLHKLGFNEVTATFANGINWDFNAIKKPLVQELLKLVSFYENNPDLKVCSIFDMKLAQILNEEEPVQKWCGTGTNMVSYSYEGNKYPCHVFQPNTTGNVVSIKEFDFNKINEFSDPECEGCIIEKICPNCYGLNFLDRGNILKRDKGLCGIVKLRALATSNLIFKKIENNTASLEPNELYQTIEAIEKIQNHLLI